MPLPPGDTFNYIPNFLSKEEASDLFDYLVNNHSFDNTSTDVSTGEAIPVNRVMFLDQELLDSPHFHPAIWPGGTLWTEPMLKIREKVESLAGKRFPVAVCIRYIDGTEGVAYHSDYTAYGDVSCIPSMSLGEERILQLKEVATDTEYEILLEQGSLLVMGEGCQENYQHALPTDPKYKNTRINITFRQYGYDN